MKTQDKKAILIDLEDEGWKFTCDNFDINIDNGLYFGNKNSYTEIKYFYYWFCGRRNWIIKWELTKLRWTKLEEHLYLCQINKILNTTSMSKKNKIEIISSGGTLKN